MLQCVKNVLKYLWDNKSAILIPTDITTDGAQATKHFRNGHIVWGSLTIVFMILPCIFKLDPLETLKHLWKILRCAYLDFKYKFLGEGTLVEEIEKIKEEVKYHDGMVVYFEDVPQVRKLSYFSSLRWKVE